MLPLFDLTKQFETTSGTLNVGGSIKVYRNGTDDLAHVYEDMDGTTIRQQPIVLDAYGRAGNVYVADGAMYRLEVYSRTGALLWTIEDMMGTGSGGGGGGGDITITSSDSTINVDHTGSNFDLTVNVPTPSVLQANSNPLTTNGPFTIYEVTKSQGRNLWLDRTTHYIRANQGWYHVDFNVVMQNSTARNQMLTVGFADNFGQWHGAYLMDLSYTEQRCESVGFDVYITENNSIFQIIETESGIPSGITFYLTAFDMHSISGTAGGGGGSGGIDGITSSDGSIVVTPEGATIDLTVANPPHDYTTRGSWDRSLQIDNTAHTISGDMQSVAIRQQINNNPSTYKYAKVCEADINTVTWINEWATTLQLSFQSSGAYYKGKSTGIFELNMENYVTQSGYQQEHEEDGKWILWDGDNKSPGLVKLRLYWRDDSSSQHYELWAETSNLKYFETIVAQALLNCSMRNHLTSSLPIEQERNVWRFNSIGIESLKDSLPTGMQLVGSWEPSSASIQPQEDHGVYYVEYGTTTFADAEAAYLAGKTLVCREIGQTAQQTRMDDLYFLIDYMPTAGTYTGHFVFSNITGYIQTNVGLTPSATYTKTMTTMATRQEVIDTLAAEIAPGYGAVVQKCYDEDSFPIPAGTYVTYPDNTSSSVLQYFYKSKVAIERWEEATSDPITAPQKWDKILVADELGKGVAYVDILQTPFADVLALYNQGKLIVGRSGYEFYRMIGYSEAWGSITSFSFQKISGPVVMTWYVNSDGPSETNNWVTPPSIYYNASIYSIATPYDETHTYSVGDVVSRDYTIYRCTTDISVAEPWTQAHWTQTSINQELARFATVARTGDYNDLINKPDVDDVVILNYGTATLSQIGTAVNAGKLVLVGRSSGGHDYYGYLAEYAYGAYSFVYKDGNYLVEMKISPDGGDGTWSMTSIHIPTVDQTFDGTSGHAQSGVAIAGELANIRNVPASTSSDAGKVLTVDSQGDAEWAQPTGLFEAVYGVSTFQQIVDAINDHKVVYCRVSPNASSRMAFLAYISSTSIEFQYYRSVSTRTATQQTDQVFVYEIKSNNTWTTTTREAGTKIAVGAGLTSSYANGTLTISLA